MRPYRQNLKLNLYDLEAHFGGVVSLAAHAPAAGPTASIAARQVRPENRVRTRLAGGGRWIRTCMGLFLSNSRFGLFPVLCSERKGRSSSRRLRSGSRSARKGSRDRNASQGLAACRLAALVFRSALTPEHAER